MKKLFILFIIVICLLVFLIPVDKALPYLNLTRFKQESSDTVKGSDYSLTATIIKDTQTDKRYLYVVGKGGSGLTEL